MSPWCAELGQFQPHNACTGPMETIVRPRWLTKPDITQTLICGRSYSYSKATIAASTSPRLAHLADGSNLVCFSHHCFGFHRCISHCLLRNRLPFQVNLLVDSCILASNSACFHVATTRLATVRSDLTQAFSAISKAFSSSLGIFRMRKNILGVPPQWLIGHIPPMIMARWHKNF
jgi:hypothetical protein